MFQGRNRQGESDLLKATGYLMLHDDTVDILVVEDDERESVSTVLALQSAIAGVNVVAVRDGTEALDFLFGRAAWSARINADPPRLILLDLALPGTDGFSVLGQIRSFVEQDVLNLTPVVVFTDSQKTGDIAKSYRCGANSYIIKPLTFPDYEAVVQAVGRYWLEHNMAAV